MSQHPPPSAGAWLAGFPKSGNTWVKLLLAAYENPTAFQLSALSRRFTADTSPVWWHLVAPVSSLDQLTLPETVALRPAVQAYIVRHVPDAVIKTHAPNGQIFAIPLIAPKFVGRAAYIVRDPRDVALSFAAHFDVSHEEAVTRLADPMLTVFRHEVIGPWSQHVSSWTRGKPPLATVTIRYEDLLADPRGTFRRLLTSWNEPVDEERLDAAVELTEFGVLQAEEKRHGFAEKPSTARGRFFRQGRAGAWRDALEPELARRIEQEHGELMSSFGYLP